MGTQIGVIGPKENGIENLSVYNGHLYGATTLNSGRLFRLTDQNDWEEVCEQFNSVPILEYKLENACRQFNTVCEYKEDFPSDNYTRKKDIEEMAGIKRSYAGEVRSFSEFERW